MPLLLARPAGPAWTTKILSSDTLGFRLRRVLVPEPANLDFAGPQRVTPPHHCHGPALASLPEISPARSRCQRQRYPALDEDQQTDRVA